MTRIVLIGVVLSLGTLGYADDDPPPPASDITVDSGGRTSAPVDVEPFGGVRWTDSLPQVIAALNKVGKFDTATLDLGGTLTASIKGMTTPAAVEKTLETLMHKAIDYPNPNARKNALASKFRTFTDKKGKEQHYWGSFIKVHAKSLNIAGVLYDVDLEFLGSPGVLQLYEKNVSFWHGEPTMCTPYYLKAMYLKVTAGTDTQKHAVWAAVRKKYPMLVEGAYGDGRLHGVDGGLDFHSGDMRYERYTAGIDKAAKQLNDTRENGGKADQSNQL